MLFMTSWLAEPITTPVAIACFIVLFFTILYSAFGIVHEAEHGALMPTV